jgi:phage virion morphogenesis protein
MAEGIEGYERLLRRIGKLATDTRRVERPLRLIGELVISSVEQNFQAQGRPQPWTPLKASTLAARRKGKGAGGAQILMNHGRLKRSVGQKIQLGLPDSRVAVGTNVIYARRQQEGIDKTITATRKKATKSGKSKGSWSVKAKTPARPFLMVQQQDKPRIFRLVTKHIEKE